MRQIILFGLVVAALASSPAPSIAATIPQHIKLVGHKAGVPDMAYGAFTISTGIPFSTVRVDFSSCPDICPAQTQALGQTVDCASRSVSKIADAVGNAEMCIIGAAHNSLPNNGACAAVYIDEVFEGTIRVGAFDLDGVAGVNMADLVLWENDFISLNNPSRADYIAPFNNVSAADLSEWVNVYLCGASSESGVLCCEQSPVTHVSDGRLNLAWDECAGGGGTDTKIFACNSNSGSTFSMVASVLAPGGANRITALDGSINFVTAAPSGIPNWWSFKGKTIGECNTLAACRASSASASHDFSLFPGGCADPWSSSGLVSLSTEYAAGGQHGRFNVGATASTPVDLSSGAETYAFRVTIDRAKTTGAGACIGCSETMCLYLSYLHLYQTDGAGILTTIYDVTLSQATNTIFWQGTAAVCATPARNVTWGRIKTLYR